MTSSKKLAIAGIESFIGFKIYLLIADLIHGLLDRLIDSFYDTILSPGIELITGNKLKKLQWTVVGNEKEITFDLGQLIEEFVKVCIMFIVIYYVYVYFQKYKDVE